MQLIECDRVGKQSIGQRLTTDHTDKLEESLPEPRRSLCKYKVKAYMYSMII